MQALLMEVIRWKSSVYYRLPAVYFSYACSLEGGIMTGCCVVGMKRCDVTACFETSQANLLLFDIFQSIVVLVAE